MEDKKKSIIFNTTNKKIIIWTLNFEITNKLIWAKEAVALAVVNGR